MDKYINKYYRLSVKVANLIYLNILWVLFTLLGLGIFGFMPATIAMYSVTRKWLTGDPNIPIFKTFWLNYKKNFMKGNLFGLMFLIASYLLLVSYKILSTQLTIPYVIAGYMVLILMLLLLMIVSYFFAIYVHFDLSFFDYIKWSFIIGINHLIITFIIVVGINILNYLMFRFISGIYLFMGISLNAYIINWAVSKIYPMYSDK